MTDKEFVLDPSEEKKETFWRKVYFHRPSGDAARREFIRCEFRVCDQDELDELLGLGNAVALREVLVNAEVKVRGDGGKTETAGFDDEIKEALLKIPYFTSAAAVTYVHAMNGAALSPEERKEKN